MKRKEVINQLEGLIEHSKDMARVEYANPAWQEDIEALEYAINFIKGRVSSPWEWLGCVMILVTLIGGLGWLAGIVYK